MVVEVFNQKGSASMSVILLFVVLYYMGDRQSTYLLYALLVLLGILRLLMIPAFGEILRSTSAKASARRSLSGTHSRQNVRAAATEAEKRTAAASAPASRHRSLAGVIMLLDVGRAATEEQEKMV